MIVSLRVRPSVVASISATIGPSWAAASSGSSRISAAPRCERRWERAWVFEVYRTASVVKQEYPTSRDESCAA
jgi:hypothetical protein